MYLISAYFDEKTNKRIEGYIKKIAKQTGNTFMTDNNVPPHLTLSSIEARSGDRLILGMEELRFKLKTGTVQMVSIGAIFPYVIYMTPVLNSYLQMTSQTIYDKFSNLSEVNISHFYRPMQWLPHVTLGKTLSKEQMRITFQVMQEEFVPFEAQIVKFGLAKTNPYEDMVVFTPK